MQTTVSLDDKLLVEAAEFTGITEQQELLREALRALMEREAARRMILLGGSQPDLKRIPRRRSRP